MPPGRFQLGIDIIINDADVNRFLARTRQSIAATSQFPSRAGPRQIEDVTSKLAQGEAAVRRNVAAGNLTPLAARTARQGLQSTAGQFGIDYTQVRAQATQINAAMRQQAAADRRAALAAEEQATAKVAAALAAKEQARAEQQAARAAERAAAVVQKDQSSAQKAADAEVAKATRARARADQQAARAAERDAQKAAAQQPDRINARKAAAVQRQVAAIEAETPAQQAAASRLKAVQETRQRAITQDAAAIQRQANADADAGASKFQQVGQAIGQRQTGNYRPAESFPGIGQLLAARAQSVLSYAAPGALLFGAITQIRAIGDEVLKLERITAQLRAQFESLGDIKGFQSFRRDLLQISRETGVAGDQVAFVGLQMKGAFGDTAVAAQRTAEAIRAAQVSGLDLVEIVDSLTAASISYGTTIDAITDQAIGLQEKFGVTANQSIKAFGDLAPVAQDVGLSLNEVAGILGVIQQRSGRSTGSIAEGLGRILPAIADQAPKILAIAAQTPELAKDASKFAEEFRKGQTGQVLLGIAASWDKLNAGARSYIVSLLGTRRDAQTILPLFQDQAKLTDYIAKANGNAGEAADYQRSQQQTLGYQLKRVHEELNQIGDALARLGALSGLALVAGGVATAIQAFGDLLRFIQQVNEHLGGIPGKFIEIAVAVRTIGAALRLIAVLQGSKFVQQIMSVLFTRGAIAGISAPGAAGGAYAERVVTEEAAAGGGALATAGNVGLGAIGGRSALGQIGGLVGGGALAGAAVVASAVAIKVGYDKLTEASRARAKKISDEISKLDTDNLYKQISQRSTLPTTLTASSDFGSQHQVRPGDVTIKGPSLADRLTADFHSIPLFGGLVRGKSAAQKYEEQLQAAVKATGQEAAKDKLLVPGKSGLTDADIKKLAGGTDDRKVLEKARKALLLLPPDQQKTLNRLLAERNSDVSQVTQEAQNTITDYQRMFERGQVDFSTYAATLRTQLALLRTADTGIPGSQEHQAVIKAEDDLNKIELDRVVNASDTAQMLLNVGGADPLTTKVNALEALVQNPTIQANPDKLREVIGQLLEAYQQQVDFELTQTGNIVNKQIPDWLNSLITGLNKQLTEPQPSGKNDAFGQSIPLPSVELPIITPPTIGPSGDNNGEKERQVAEQNAQARVAVAVANANGDALLIAQLQAGAAGEAEARAKLGTKAEQLNAEAERIKSQRSLRDALFNVQESAITLAIAIAQSVGDLAKVGQLTIKAAQDELDKVLRETPNDTTAINLAKAKLVDTQTSEAKRQQSQKVDDLEWMFEQDKITAQAFIAALTADLSTIPESNIDLRRQIMRRILQLRKDLSQNVGFNLPTTFALPTLYEGRRLNQTAGQYVTSSSYVDNRQIVINAATTLTAAQLEEAVSGAWGDAPRTGMVGKAY